VALITAIFLLTVVAALVVYMAKISRVGGYVPTLSDLSVRAAAAARAGLEAGIYTVTVSNANPALDCASATTDCCPAAPTAVALGGTYLSGFQVVWSCAPANTSLSVSEGSSTYRVYALQATATYGTLGQIDFFQRTLAATVVKQ
jgi:hypothetical protein